MIGEVKIETDCNMTNITTLDSSNGVQDIPYIFVASIIHRMKLPRCIKRAHNSEPN